MSLCRSIASIRRFLSAWGGLTVRPSLVVVNAPPEAFIVTPATSL